MKAYNEILSDVTKTATKIPQSDYLDAGKYRIFDQGKEYSVGFSNDEQGVATDYPYIIFGDHTRIVKYVDEPCYIGADGVKLLKVINKDFNPRFVYYNILAKPIESQGYARHFKFVKEIQFTEKPLSTQKNIVTELDTIQSAIDNKKQQLSLLDEAVKSKFVEMFGNPVDNNKSFPKRRMIDVCPIQESKTQIDSESVWLLNLDMIEQNTGAILEKQIVPVNEVGNSTIQFSSNHVLYSKLRPYLNKVALPDEIGYASNELVPFLPSEEINKIYFACLLRSDAFVELINSKSGGAKMPRASMDFIRKFEIPVPPLSLQNRFAAFVQKIDKSKSIVKQQIIDLQELLDSKMQEYFG